MQNIYNIANELIDTFKTNDPFAIVTSLPIRLDYKDLSKLSGYFLRYRDNNHIVINNKLDWDKRIIVCAHELGHYFLHRQFTSNAFFSLDDMFINNNKLDKEANIFMAELLISDETFLELACKGYSYIQIASTLETNVNVILYKIFSMNKRGFQFNISEYGDSRKMFSLLQ